MSIALHHHRAAVLPHAIPLSLPLWARAVVALDRLRRTLERIGMARARHELRRVADSYEVSQPEMARALRAAAEAPLS